MKRVINLYMALVMFGFAFILSILLDVFVLNESMAEIKNHISILSLMFVGFLVAFIFAGESINKKEKG